MIVFITTANHGYTHDSVRAESELEVQTVPYVEFYRLPRPLPPATYVFTDFDRLSANAMMLAARAYRELRKQKQTALNDPARIRSRSGLLRALHRAGINDFDAYRAEEMEAPRRWPVFLRFEGDHLEPLTGLLHDAKELEESIEKAVCDGVPRSALLIVEYAAEPVRPGLYRKLSVFRVGESFLGYTCVHDDQWVVKHGKPGIAPPELYDEEYEMVARNPFGEAMRAVFDIAGVDYGRVDFGLVRGRPQIYEINSNPDLQLNAEPTAIDRRNQSNALFRKNFLAALKAIDTPRGTLRRAEKASIA